MTLSKSEIKQLLERIIFDQEQPQEWVQDVWGMSPTLGENAAKLLEIFDALVECCPDERLENLLHSFYQEHFE